MERLKASEKEAREEVLVM